MPGRVTLQDVADRSGTSRTTAQVWLQPPLSSVAMPHRELATAAVQLLLAEGDLRESEARVPLRLRLRLRESIARPGASRGTQRDEPS